MLQRGPQKSSKFFDRKVIQEKLTNRYFELFYGFRNISLPAKSHFEFQPKKFYYYHARAGFETLKEQK